MVATRRGARTGPPEELDMEDATLNLRKKPVRKATAAKAATATKAAAKPAPKPRTTRSKATAVEQAAESETQDASEADELQDKPVAKRATRSGRAETIEPEESQVTESQKTAVKPQRTTRTKAAAKSTKPEAKVNEAPSLQPSMVSKPVRQTRAKAQAAKPLSPKKITQVSKARTRSAISTDEAKPTKTANTRAAVAPQTTRTGRKRTVSDENADVREHIPDDVVSNVGSDIIEAGLPPVKYASPRKVSPTKAPKAPSEASMSSRATTPSQSPAPTFDQPKDYTEDHMDDARSEADGDDASEALEASGSEDELAGAQTPMKRCTQQDDSRFFHSAQKTTRTTHPHAQIETPAPRFGRQRSKPTPQTHKPYSKPAVPASEARPMTVTRGEARAFVFEGLKQLSPSAPKTSLAPSQHGEREADEDEYFVQPNSPARSEAAASVAQSEAENEHTDDEPTTQDGDVNETIVISDGEDESGLTVDSPTVQPPVATYAPGLDETQLTADSEPLQPPVDTYESDESVLVTPIANREVAVESESEEVEDTFAVFDPKTPRPETIMWENLREDVTIPANFDLHFADVRSPANVVAASNDLGALDMSDLHQAEGGAVEDGSAAEPVRTASAPDPTLNLNDFVDFDALAEPTLRLDAQAAAQDMVHDLTESEDEGEDLEDECAGVSAIDSEKEDGDITVIISGKAIAQKPEHSVLEPAVPELEAGDRRASVAGNSDGPEELSDNAAAPAEQELFEDLAHADQEAASSCEAVEVIEDEVVPHYALPTLAFDARRKSLPAFSHMTPIKPGSRPNTSDGASIARIANPFEQPWWARSAPGSTVATPVRARPSNAHGTSPAKSFVIPSKAQAAASPSKTPVATPGERFPRRAPREGYEEHAQTVAAPARFRTPVPRSVKRPATVQRLASQTTTQPVAPSPKPASVAAAPAATPRTRYPRLAARQTYEEHANTAAPATRFQSPAHKSPKRPSTVQRMPSQAKPMPSTPSVPAAPVAESSPAVAPVETPIMTPRARFPRLTARETYEEHASTVVAPARLHTPTQSSPKRPSTTTNGASPRKNVTFKPSTPRSSHTPIKTPLKPPGMTPGNVPMTPHPAAPLRGILALVEVFTLDGASASAPFIALLQRLGAKTTKSWSERVTHVVFKDGSPTTLQRVRLHNKTVEQEGKGAIVHCVNSRWVSDCDAQSYRVDEADEAYAVDVTDVPRGGSRRRKSMEPSALLNIGGNIVRDRKSSSGRLSIGRSSLGRSPIKAISFESPAKTAEEDGEKENSPACDEPATPAYLAAPDKLVQMTAPMNRVRKLEIKGEGKGRRLTSLWE